MRTTTTKKTIAFPALAGALLAVALTAGCSVEPGAPEQPTYEGAVRPILMSHCVRCHGYPALGDPTSTNPAAQNPPTAPARFDVYGDTNCPQADGGAACIFGAGAYATLMVAYIGDHSPLAMPPPPAAPLTKYQIDTIKAWASMTPPLEK